MSLADVPATSDSSLEVFYFMRHGMDTGFKNCGREPEHTYDKIVWARNILGLPESATMHEIKDNYRRLINKWHPDKCFEDKKNAVK